MVVCPLLMPDVCLVLVQKERMQALLAESMQRQRAMELQLQKTLEVCVSRTVFVSWYCASASLEGVSMYSASCENDMWYIAAEEREFVGPGPERGQAADRAGEASQEGNAFEADRGSQGTRTSGLLLLDEGKREIGGIRTRWPLARP
jgi:hypothetical protein